MEVLKWICLKDYFNMSFYKNTVICREGEQIDINDVRNVYHDGIWIPIQELSYIIADNIIEQSKILPICQYAYYEPTTNGNLILRIKTYRRAFLLEFNERDHLAKWAQEKLLEGCIFEPIPLGDSGYSEM